MCGEEVMSRTLNGVGRVVIWREGSLSIGVVVGGIWDGLFKGKS